jgi:hypothetical protein
VHDTLDLGFNREVCASVISHASPTTPSPQTKEKIEQFNSLLQKAPKITPEIVQQSNQILNDILNQPNTIVDACIGMIAANNADKVSETHNRARLIDVIPQIIETNIRPDTPISDQQRNDLLRTIYKLLENEEPGKDRPKDEVTSVKSEGKAVPVKPGDKTTGA